MYDENIISRMNDYLHKAAQALASWLSVMLPKSGEDWWEECVLSNLSYPQRELIEKKGLSKLEELDLAALLRVANKSWYTMRGYAYLPTSERECIRDMIGVRNNWAHVSAELPGKDTTLSSMAVLGEISISGTMIKVDELANALQVCLDSGAKKVLLPITSAADLGTVPADLIGCFNLIFYSSAEDAVFKALGVE